MITEINPDMNMGFLPIPLNDDASMDVLPVGVPNNWVLNKNSEHLEEAKTFLNWMVSSETGKRYITEEFAFIPAFDNIEATGLGDLGQSILEYSKAEKTIGLMEQTKSLQQQSKNMQLEKLIMIQL
jgi:raffinose/stachyose/melibiose transport system substrate-binding protein